MYALKWNFIIVRTYLLPISIRKKYYSDYTFMVDLCLTRNEQAIYITGYSTKQATYFYYSIHKIKIIFEWKTSPYIS